jgi:hypothetical protein
MSFNMGIFTRINEIWGSSGITKIPVFLNMTLCSLTETYWHCEEPVSCIFRIEEFSMWQTIASIQGFTSHCIFLYFSSSCVTKQFYFTVFWNVEWCGLYPRNSSVLKIHAVGPFKMFVTTYPSTQCQISEHPNLKIHGRGKQKSQISNESHMGTEML